jgi:hypothetical protein
MATDASTSAWTILVVYLLIDAARYAIGVVYDLEPLLRLQKEITSTSRSLQRSRRSDDEEVYARRLRKLRTKLETLELRRTTRTRRMMRLCHYLGLVKAAAGATFAVMNRDRAMFSLPGELLWPFERWLAFPGGLERGDVGAVPWTLLSAVGVERGTRGAWGPILFRPLLLRFARVEIAATPDSSPTRRGRSRAS